MPILSKAATAAALGASLAMRQAADTSQLGIKTPIMGYNTYNDVACTPTEAHSNQMIDAMVSQGFRDAGYKFFQIDCGWQGYTRDKNEFGAIDTDTERFPNGIPPISKKAIDNGLIFSMYSDAGIRTCDTTVPSQRLGSDQHEVADAKQFASWNVQYVKCEQKTYPPKIQPHFLTGSAPDCFMPSRQTTTATSMVQRPMTMHQRTLAQTTCRTTLQCGMHCET